MCVDPTFSYHGFHAATPCWNQTCRFISRRVQSPITHCSQGVAANNVGDVVQMLEAFCLFMRGTNMHHVVARIKERQERMLFEDAALHLLMPGNGFKKFICFNADAAGRWQRVPVQTAIHVAAIMHGFASVIFLINVIVYLFKHLPICVYLLRRHCRYHKYFWYYPSYCCIDNTGCSYWKLHAAGIGCDSCLFFWLPKHNSGWQAALMNHKESGMKIMKANCGCSRSLEK